MRATGNVLVIGDTHIPFEHRHYLDFCLETKKKYNCSLIYHIGDVADFHAISQYSHNPDGFSPYDELEVAVERLKPWYKAFPKVEGICIGNHDERLQKTAWKYGLSEKLFKGIDKILEFPTGWKSYKLDFYIYGVRIFHGMGYSGKYAHSNASVENQQSIVMGHLHTNAGVMWSASEHNLIFGLAVGCGIDRNTYAFRYGRDFRRKPILGCGVILDDGRNGVFVPMEM